MRPMSRHFGEIHGVDISARWSAWREKLAGITRSLPTLPTQTWKHSRLVVRLRIFLCRLPAHSQPRSGVRLPQRGCTGFEAGRRAAVPIEWTAADRPRIRYLSGLRVSAGRSCIATEEGLLLLALEGMLTQYMWATQKPARAAGRRSVKIRRINSAFSSSHCADPRPVCGVRAVGAIACRLRLKPAAGRRRR
jgi:hypothetical protein